MRHARWFTAALALAACGDSGTGPAPAGSNDYALSGTSPYPQSVAAGQVVRSVVLRAENRAGAMMNELRCGYSFMLFTATRASTQTPTATGSGGDCKLYMQPPERDYSGQGWLCAGAITTNSGDLMQTSGFCPEGGSAGPWEGNFRGCGAFFSGRNATVYSADEIGPDDRVTDLMGEVRFPGTPTITQPTTLPVVTWPSAGDLAVAWTGADATSVMVRLEPDAADRAGPTIVCTPRRNGGLTVDASLLNQSGLRAMNARLRVWAFRETTVQAEGRAWTLAGAAGSNVLLQPAR
jgi:hypothetical protein